MWSPDAAGDLFPRRPRRSSGNSSQQQRRSSASSQLWAFPPSSAGFAGPSADFSDAQDNKPQNHGLIGSYANTEGLGAYANAEGTARMLWNRPEREEEEREEEALPSYLSYLQAPTDATTVAAPATLVGTSIPIERESQMETKSKELARALQDFIAVQMGQSGAAVGSNVVGGCSCERRVMELERQMQTLQAAKTESAATATEDANSALGDRVSTLEGRQSAFQSQLAQISKVLGVPVGKHGKSSQLKTLVQTLREEIDAKVQAAIAEVEASCVATAKKHAEELIAEAAASSSSPAGESSTPSEPKDHKKQVDGDSDSVSGLPFSAVLNALAEEHEASLTRLSTHFDERLRLEGSQRVALEGRVRARLGELEEWIQQVEGELGGSHFEAVGGAASSSSIAAITDELNKLQTQMAHLEQSWTQQSREAEELSKKLAKLPSSDELKANMERQVSELAALRENVASVETVASTTREETQSAARTSQGLKLIVEKLVRDTGSAEELLQQYVSTITHQVASVTRQYVSVRIRDNNRLLDATLRARVPDYVANESESFLLVRPEAKKEGDVHANHDAAGPDGTFSFVLREDDEDGIRRLLNAQQPPKPSTIGTTISSDASAVAAAAGASSSA